MASERTMAQKMFSWVFTQNFQWWGKLLWASIPSDLSF